MSLAWGGFANGVISGTAMHVVPNFLPIYSGVSVALASNMMMTEAAVQFSGLAEAFFRKFGKPLNVSEAYRRLDRQQTLYADYKAGRGNLAAYPGTSNHGWGRSIDLASNVNINGSAENAWARATAPSYGFQFTVPTEAWHVDYMGSPATRVAAYISDPNTTPETHTPTEEEMTKVRIIRNNTKGDANFGSIDAFCVETGMWRHMPSQDYADAWKSAYGVTTVEDAPANWWSYWKQMTNQTADEARDAVWNSVLSGFNGKQTAGTRLMGIDDKADDLDANAIKKIVAALPQAAGGGGVDIDALAKAIAPLVSASVSATIAKAVNDDAAKRMQS